MNSLGLSRRHFFRLLGLVLLPLVIAGVYIGITEIQSLYRFNKAYFTPAYQQTYSAPGAVAIALEEALRKNDERLYAELTALREPRAVPKPNPDVRLLILWEVSQRDYFDYLFFNIKTYERAMHHVKKIDDRWVLVPQDFFYYLDSGEWVLTFTPLAALWWLVLFVAEVGVIVFRFAAKTREALYNTSYPSQ